VPDILEALMVADIRAACDILRPVNDDSGHVDGYVSLEVSPHLAYHPEASVHKARHLFQTVNRPNLFIKIPGTRPGLAAIEQLLFDGINVNITLLCSVSRYEAVAETSIRALERRREEGLPLDAVASVASFFLSHTDVLGNQLLEQRIVPPNGATPRPDPKELLGKAGAANAKLAYRSFKRILASERWRQLEERGARVQRMLWASHPHQKSRLRRHDVRGAAHRPGNCEHHAGEAHQSVRRPWRGAAEYRGARRRRGSPGHRRSRRPAHRLRRSGGAA
jgi:transaldolase